MHIYEGCFTELIVCIWRWNTLETYTEQEESGRPKEKGQTHKAFNIGFNFQEADSGLTYDVSKVQTIKRDVYI